MNIFELKTRLGRGRETCSINYREAVADPSDKFARLENSKLILC